MKQFLIIVTIILGLSSLTINNDFKEFVSEYEADPHTNPLEEIT